MPIGELGRWWVELVLGSSVSLNSCYSSLLGLQTQRAMFVHLSGGWLRYDCLLCWRGYLRRSKFSPRWSLKNTQVPKAADMLFHPSAAWQSGKNVEPSIPHTWLGAQLPRWPTNCVSGQVTQPVRPYKWRKAKGAFPNCCKKTNKQAKTINYRPMLGRNSEYQFFFNEGPKNILYL